jgi:hypothetical protein
MDGLRVLALLSAASLAACSAGMIESGAPPDDDPLVLPDAGVEPDPDPDPIAIPELDGEILAMDGDNTVSVATGEELLYRVETVPDEHVAFQLTFDASIDGVALQVDRWNGTEIEMLATTDGGSGIRTLAVLDQESPNVFWVRVRAEADSLPAGTLKLTRTPFTDGVRCTTDCTRLMQMPLPNNPLADGYDVSSGTIFRYQFGRRDMIMFVRQAGKLVAERGLHPMYPADFSQWNGLTPGTDTGSLRHASHQRGKDVDISLYNTEGYAPWRSYCTAEYTSEGRECVTGTLSPDFDGYENALMYASFLDSGRVTMSFMDTELIKAVKPAAGRAVEEGVLKSSLLPLYSDGRHLQHWPNHDNHIHVRVSEEDYAKPLRSLDQEPFEAP